MNMPTSSISPNVVNMVNNLILMTERRAPSKEEALLISSVCRTLKMESDMMFQVLEPQYEQIREEQHKEIINNTNELARHLGYTVDDDRKHSEYLREPKESGDDPLGPIQPLGT